MSGNFSFFHIVNNGYFIAFLIVYVVLVAGLGAWVADKKGYSVIPWFFMCLLTGIAGLIAISGVPSQENGTEDTNESPDVPWVCKKCESRNHSETITCRVCGAKLE
jgi:uncharacterized paraquat-inducible protein A